MWILGMLPDIDSAIGHGGQSENENENELG
jgi:hypothetical protein